MHRYYIPCVVASSSHMRCETCVLLRTARQYYYLFSNSQLSPLTSKLTARVLFHATADSTADSNTRQGAYITLYYSTHERLMTGYRQVWSIIQPSVVFGIFQRYHNFDSASLARIWSWASAYGGIFLMTSPSLPLLWRHLVSTSSYLGSLVLSGHLIDTFLIVPIEHRVDVFRPYRRLIIRRYLGSLAAFSTDFRRWCAILYIDQISYWRTDSLYPPFFSFSEASVICSIYFNLPTQSQNAPINDRDISIQWRSNCQTRGMRRPAVEMRPCTKDLLIRLSSWSICFRMCALKWAKGTLLCPRSTILLD